MSDISREDTHLVVARDVCGRAQLAERRDVPRGASAASATTAAATATAAVVAPEDAVEDAVEDAALAAGGREREVGRDEVEEHEG